MNIQKRQTWEKFHSTKTMVILDVSKGVRHLSLQIPTQADSDWEPRAWSAMKKWTLLARKEELVLVTQVSLWAHEPDVCLPGKVAFKKREREAVTLHSLFLNYSGSCHSSHDGWPKDRSDFFARLYFKIKHKNISCLLFHLRCFFFKSLKINTTPFAKPTSNSFPN